jgi:hypothetical protein
VNVDETGIANPYLKNEYYKRNNNSDQWIDVENGKYMLNMVEHFIVWMEMETFSSFKKLWGRIDSNLESDTYKIIIEDSTEL